MKANYPVEFLAASMQLDISNTEKLAVFRRVRDEIRRVFEAYAAGRLDA